MSQKQGKCAQGSAPGANVYLEALIDATCKRREVSFKATNSLAERTIPLGEKTTKLTLISNKMNTAYDRMAHNLSLSQQVTNEMCQEGIKIAYRTDPD